MMFPKGTHSSRITSPISLPSHISSTITSAVIDHITELSALERTPLEVFTDNKQPFSSKEWYTFPDKYGFKHTTSSLYYSQSNGFLKKNVHTMKSAFSEAKTSKVPVPKACMKLWQTSIVPYLPHPTEILHNQSAGPLTSLISSIQLP